MSVASLNDAIECLKQSLGSGTQQGMYPVAILERLVPQFKLLMEMARLRARGADVVSLLSHDREVPGKAMAGDRTVENQGLNLSGSELSAAANVERADGEAIWDGCESMTDDGEKMEGVEEYSRLLEVKTERRAIDAGQRQVMNAGNCDEERKNNDQGDESVELPVEEAAVTIGLEEEDADDSNPQGLSADLEMKAESGFGAVGCSHLGDRLVNDDDDAEENAML